MYLIKTAAMSNLKYNSLVVYKSPFGIYLPSSFKEQKILEVVIWR